MLEKDELKIKDELKKLIKEFLLTEFLDYRGKSVESVEYVDIIDIEYDKENENQKKLL